jgi:hypothetical protein
MARLLIYKTEKGHKNIKKYIPVLLCTPILPEFAE